MVPRLIATDLDGTFLSPDGSVSEENRRVVADAAAAGLLLVFATGRPPRWLQVIAELPLAHPIVVASNGALLWDLDENRALDSMPLEHDLAAETVNRIRRVVPGVCFAVEQGWRFGREPAYESAMRHLEISGDPRFFAGSVDELITEPFVKLLVQQPELTAEELAQRVSAEVGDSVEITYSVSSNTGLLEISAPGVTKAAALERYCTSLGIDAGQVAAFGDMPNDRTMLEWAGAAYIMADAHPSLDDIGATRIGTNTESAVGRTIREWL